MKLACRSCALAAASLNALGKSRRKITLISTSLWAIPARSSAPIARRCSVTIRAWANTKLIQQIVLTATWTDACGTSTPLYRETPRPACTAKRLTIPLRPRRLYTQRLGPGVLARNSWASARSVCNVASSRHRSARSRRSRGSTATPLKFSPAFVRAEESQNKGRTGRRATQSPA